MLTMHVTARRLGEEDVASYDHLLSGRGPTAQAEHSAPIALVHDAVADQRVILAMVHQRQIKHPGVFECPAHEFIALYTMAVVGYRDHTRSFKRTDRRQLFSGNVLGDGAGNEDVHETLLARR